MIPGLDNIRKYQKNTVIILRSGEQIHKYVYPLLG